jgi:hypothetical protein
MGVNVLQLRRGVDVVRQKLLSFPGCCRLIGNTTVGWVDDHNRIALSGAAHEPTEVRNDLVPWIYSILDAMRR